MYCKVCNTRLGLGTRTCQNCGSDAGPIAAFQRPTQPGPLPSADLSTARDESLDDEDDEEVVELDDVTGEIPEAEPKAAPAAPARSTSRPGTTKPIVKSAGRRAAEKPAAKNAPRGGAPLFAPDPAGLRALLIERPESLEPGLGVFRNERGETVGADFSTGVGEIDLLATDARGGLVVVMVSERGQGEELVAEVLQRVGWVRKHLGEGRKKVRGIVLCEQPPESLSYAAAAVADTIAFKTYRVALTFEDLEF